MIRLEHLEKDYSGVKALCDVNLCIERGDIFGIIGPSGAGKSTLVRCINLLEKPTAGRVLLDGVDLSTLSSAQLRAARRQMPMIFQNFNLLSQRSALANVAFPLELAGAPRRAARARAKELLETVGLSDRAEAYPAQLSGGQKQRVAIARALASEPRVLLCDEATSALDPATADAVLMLLQRVNRTLGVSIVLITHRMRDVARICTKAAVLDEGSVAECASVRELFAAPKSEAARRLLLPQEFDFYEREARRDAV